MKVFNRYQRRRYSRRVLERSAGEWMRVSSELSPLSLYPENKGIIPSDLSTGKQLANLSDPNVSGTLT